MLDDSMKSGAQNVADQVSTLLTTHHTVLEDTVSALLAELRKSRGDSDYYRKKLAVSLNEHKLMENQILELKQEVRAKDDEVRARELDIVELKQENDALQRELQRLGLHSNDLRALVDAAFDDSGRNRRLLQQHIHHGCDAEPCTIEREVGTSAAAVDAAVSTAKQSSPDPRTPRETVGTSFTTTAIEQAHSRPLPMSNTVAGVATLPMSPVPPLEQGHPATRSPAELSGLPFPQMPSSAFTVAYPTHSNNNNNNNTTPVDPQHPTAVAVDKGRSMGVLSSERDMICVASVDHAVACYTAFSGEDLHFLVNIRSSKISDVSVGIESESTGSVCTFGFRNDGYVLAVTRTSWSQQRDVWRAVLKNPIHALSISPVELQMEIIWRTARRTLDIFLNGENLTNGDLFLTNAAEQPSPYYPVVTLPCQGDEVRVLQAAT